jgi:hypothetical protein
MITARRQKGLPWWVFDPRSSCRPLGSLAAQAIGSDAQYEPDRLRKQ